MTEDKGYIDTKNIREGQAFNLIREFLNKVENDVINIKNPEIVAINELITKIEKDYYKFKKFNDFLRPGLTPKQKTDYIEYLEEF